MDGTKKRVTFDGDEANNEELPPVETEETNGNEEEDAEVDETEDDTNGHEPAGDLIEEYDESMSLKKVLSRAINSRFSSIES